ncbi:MAG TPA: T9SS type A sorting domain-containing protein [Pelobium sp.]
MVNVNSKGNNGETYSAIDFSPFAGISYYELSQTDADGKTEELGIKTIKLTDLKERSLSVYPNPVVNGLINFQTNGLNGLKNIFIFDLNGKKVLSEQIPFTNGTATLKLRKQLAKGSYILKVGSANINTKIIIE